MQTIIRFLFIIVLLNIFSVDVFSQPAFEEGEFKSKDVTLFYKCYGSKGDFIVLLAGGPGSSVDYMQPICDSLKAYYRCIMLEQRGTGRSALAKYDNTTVRMDLYVDDLEALRKHIKTDKLTLIGNSWGSMLALLYGAAYPSHVSRIITLGSGPISSFYARVFDDNFRVRLLPHEVELRNLWREKRNNSSTYLVANYEMDKAGTPAYYYNRQIGLKAAMAFKPSDMNYYIFPSFDQAHPEFDLRPVLKNITADVLLVQGRQDLAGEANVLEIHSLIKQSSLKFIERCGHMPWEEKPLETWKLVYTFLGIK